ncbi:MAG: ABC transporter permease, partial [Peptococcia bacterium]
MLSGIKKYWSSVALIIFLLVLWEAVVKLGEIPGYILPSPLGIVEALRDTYWILWAHCVRTLQEVSLGFFLAVIAGMLLAVLMGIFPALKKALYPLIVISQTVPIMAVAPLLIIWFGYGLLPKMLVVTLVCFFPITVSLVEGFENV